MFAYVKNIRDEIQVLYAGKIFIEIRVIRYISSNLFAFHRLILNGMTVYQDLAFGEIKHTHNRTYSGGFTGTVVTYETVYISALNMKRYIIGSFLIPAV